MSESVRNAFYEFRPGKEKILLGKMLREMESDGSEGGFFTCGECGIVDVRQGHLVNVIPKLRCPVRFGRINPDQKLRSVQLRLSQQNELRFKLTHATKQLIDQKGMGYGDPDRQSRSLSELACPYSKALKREWINDKTGIVLF